MRVRQTQGEADRVVALCAADIDDARWMLRDQLLEQRLETRLVRAEQLRPERAPDRWDAVAHAGEGTAEDERARHAKKRPPDAQVARAHAAPQSSSRCRITCCGSRHC